MNFAHFFIRRPRFAAVLSILIVILGILSWFTLPVTQYPEVAPPTVVVTASYPGATPDVIAETVAAPLEQEINGVEGMIYMSSQATADGGLQITATFEIGTDLDTAQVLVQNRVARAEARLPDVVRRIGVIVQKSSPDLMMVINLFSPDESYDLLYVSNYALLQVREPIRRIDGVGDARLFGSREFSMRVWLDPGKMASLELTPGDVIAALREQNVQVAAGVLNQPPIESTAGAFQLSISARGRLDSVKAFESIIVRTGGDNRTVFLRDVARVELGALDYGVNNYVSGTPAVAMPIFQRPGSNALETAKAIRGEMKAIASRFPEGLDYTIIYDPTLFIEDSIKAVLKTLAEAILLVVLVILVFLQTWRASFVPLVAIPISLIGTFIAMAALGFSINNLTLFGLVLAIGIVVDDAIVVVENISRNIEEGLKPIDAAFKAMTEVSGAVIATTLVMIAIFVPTAFLPGISGQFFQQFALTIAVSVSISSFVSLTLSPSLGGLLLRHPDDEPDLFTRIEHRVLGNAFHAFNHGFDWLRNQYARLIGFSLRAPWTVILVYAGLLGLTWLGFQRVPGGFIPPQDQGYCIIAAQLPNGASFERTDEVIRTVMENALEVESITDVVAFAGFNGATFANAPNAGAMFPVFAPFEERIASGRSGTEIINDLRMRLANINEAFVVVIPPPPVRGVGTGGGFKMMLQDRNNLGVEALEQAAQAMMFAAMEQPEISGAFTFFNADTPQLFADLDRTRAKMLGVPVSEVFSAMQVCFGSLFVNELTLYGRSYRVTAQADADFRNDADDLHHIWTRSDNGAAVPLSSLVDLEEQTGTDRFVRYNLYPSAEVQGDAAPGVSTGQALAKMEALAEGILPPGMDYEWTDLSFQQKEAATSPLRHLIFPLAVLFVFLVLVAQYENWSLPLAIILIVPLCVTGAIWLIAFRGMDNNVLSQIGFVVLVGLAAKNAILIVEFAKQKEDAGMSRHEATITAARLRLRPILMTSFAFVLGVLPLMTATGAGAEMRQALGTVVFGGMLGVTLFGILITPTFYSLIRKYSQGSNP